MTGSRPDDETSFHTARDIPDPDRRREYVREACGGDEGRIAHVEALLAAADTPDSLLDHPPVGPAGEKTRTEPAAPDAEVPLDFLAPSDKPGLLGRLGHYEVRQVVGRGGMGVVLKAFDESLHRVVAIKVMAPQLASSATARARFTREARAQAAVAHEHVVTIHAVEEANGLPYIVMQCVAGQSLQDRLDRTGPLPPAEVLRIGMQAASGLAAAHAQGLVHRDVKPANILLENGVERVELTDFGLARAADDANLTQSGAVAGTPQYMSPEQAEGKRVDARSDLFSLGSVLYAMCTGRPPFRASTSMAVLKRVCEDTATPVREVNPEVPDWLAEVIAKLHAKDPAGRFQSAAEVAELLGRHLAHFQHPSVVPLAAAGKPAALPSPAPRRHRWATAVVALLALVAVLGVTEASGVTRLRATVIRLFTPEGTLVVETNDPAVKIVVEGDGDLVITGAGPQEVRLRAGSYKLRATKDGRPVKLDQELVTISRGDTKIVRVRLEGEMPAAATPKDEVGAFVLLGSKGIAERKFDTLAEAVLGASDGDTIEVRGNGPFLTPPLTILRAGLIIRAGVGFRPVLEASPDSPEEHLLHAAAPLTLEGLEFRRAARPDRKARYLTILKSRTALHVANCRFVSWNTEAHIETLLGDCDVRNCEFLAAPMCNTGAKVIYPYSVRVADGKRVAVDNCLLTIPIEVNQGVGNPGVSVRLTRNTFGGGYKAIRFVAVAPNDRAKDFADADWADQALRVEATGNVIQASVVLDFTQRAKDVLPPGEAEACLARMASWQGERNAYATWAAFLLLTQAAPWRDLPAPKLPAGLAGWKKQWGTQEAGSVEGKVHYQNGDPLAKIENALETVTPEDFRLQADSAGYRAGKDGKDLGADLDLVGPGPAYERWKTSPAYQEWLKETGQLRARVAPKAEPGAFVLLGGKGVAERKFDTLAEAVQHASGGDTVEVRGNGPFAIDPVVLRTPLVIRAGAGFRPVIEASDRFCTTVEARSEQWKDDVVLLQADAPLVLEGLEFRCRPGDRKVVGRVYLLKVSQALHVANCRFLTRNADRQIVPTVAGRTEARNCEFLLSTNYRTTTGESYGASAIAPGAGTHLVMDNCLATTWLIMSWGKGDPGKGSIRLTRNTFRTRLQAFLFTPMDRDNGSGTFAEADWPAKAFRLEATANLFHGSSVFNFAYTAKKVLPPGDAEACLARMVGWQGERNVYLVQNFLGLMSRTPPAGPWVGQPSKLPEGLAGWKQMWGSAEAGSVEGPVRYRDGDPLARIENALETVTPEDFRLRADSAGYRAGKDGKDLGADVDLVGPGPAYERWKKTAAYQEWLKETGQLKK
jgi:hypothetical protein